ncbi:hypothetical protein HK096_001773 [Nowakowskiella sp. JEL0078]|nr:hypothetical protein HK096_001773 [Nowakowskiella sp. JEL0078]
MRRTSSNTTLTEDTIEKARSKLSFLTPPPDEPINKVQVDEAVQRMDKIHGTSFYSWIKSESNIGYICTYKSKLFEHYFSLDESGPARVGRALCWLTDWSVANKAALILKLFYHWNIESTRFSRIVSEMLVDDSDKISNLKSYKLEENLEFIQVLLIGEPPVVSALFVKNLLQDCGNFKVRENQKITRSIQDAIRILSKLASMLHWSERFLYDMVQEFANIMISDQVSRRELLNRLDIFGETSPSRRKFPISRGGTWQTLLGSDPRIKEAADHTESKGLSKMSTLDIKDEIEIRCENRVLPNQELEGAHKGKSFAALMSGDEIVSSRWKSALDRFLTCAAQIFALSSEFSPFECIESKYRISGFCVPEVNKDEDLQWDESIQEIPKS